MKILIRLVTMIGCLNLIGLSITQASEESWMSVSLTMPTLKNKISGFTTDRGSFRMSALYPTRSTLQMSGGYFTHSDLATAIAKCRALAPTLTATRTRSTRSYAFSAFVYPFAESEMSHLEVQFENKPNLWKAEATLSLNEKNVLSSDSVKEFERRVNSELDLQLENIKKTGRLEFTIGQIDDVACALVTGTAVLEINFGMSFELAKHIRETMISASDFTKIYERLKQKSYRVTGQNSRSLISGALLAEALRDQFAKSLDDYGINNFLKLAGALFAPTTGLLQSYSAQDMNRVAESLDNLRIYPAPAGLRLSLSPELVQ